MVIGQTVNGRSLEAVEACFDVDDDANEGSLLLFFCFPFDKMKVNFSEQPSVYLEVYDAAVSVAVSRTNLAMADTPTDLESLVPFQRFLRHPG